MILPFPATVVKLSAKVMENQCNKNTADDGGVRFAVSVKNKKSKQTATSPLTRRSGNQRSVGSAHISMSSTAAAELLGIKNISRLYDVVKPAIVIDIKIQNELSTIAANGFAKPTIYSRALSATTNVSQNDPKVKNGKQYISSVNYENERSV